MSGKTIAFMAEVQQGALAPISFELLKGARELANSMEGDVLAFLLGDSVESQAQELKGADRVMVVSDPLLSGFTPQAYVDVLAHLIETENPQAVLLGSTTIGLDLASILSERLQKPSVLGCRNLQSDGEQLVATCQLYAGKMMAEVAANQFPALFVVLPGSYRELREGNEPKVENITAPVPLEAGAVVFEEMILPEAGDVDITQQDILIAIGRGIQQEDNLEIAEELADALGGVLCASRPVVDQGWLPTTRQVGKSGMMVKPKFYLALGISGAPEHIEGMKDSDLIVAINSDAHAPIFDAADYGIVTDLLDFTPALTEALKSRAHA